MGKNLRLLEDLHVHVLASRETIIDRYEIARCMKLNEKGYFFFLGLGSLLIFVSRYSCMCANIDVLGFLNSFYILMQVIKIDEGSGKKLIVSILLCCDYLSKEA